MMDSIATGVGYAVLVSLFILLFSGLLILLWILIIRVKEYIEDRDAMIRRKLNKRYRILLKVKDGSRDKELNALVNEAIEFDTMIYAYLFDKEAYEKIKTKRRKRAKPTGESDGLEVKGGVKELAQEFNKYFVSGSSVDVDESVRVKRDEWRELYKRIQKMGVINE